MDVLGAAKSDVIEACFGTRMHTPARLEPFRRIIPSAAADYFGCPTLRTFRISHIPAHETFRKPIRDPFGSIARQVVDTIRALAGLATTDRHTSSCIRTV